MAIVEIDSTLIKKIHKIFKKESIQVFEFLKSLEQYPEKGKLLFSTKKYQLKELKYNLYRFYFIKENNKLYVLDEKLLKEEVLTFLDLSKKNNQQDVINKLKIFLKKKNI